MNKKLVSFVCCPAVVGSCSGLVGSAINEEVPNFIVYTSDNSAFKSDDLHKVYNLINDINYQMKKSNELLALDKKYGPFVAFGDCFRFSDLSKYPVSYLSNLLVMASSNWSNEIATREDTIENLQLKLVNKAKEKREFFLTLVKSISESQENFSKVLGELNRGNIFGGPLHVCVEYFYTLLPQYEKLKKDLEGTKNLEKQGKIKADLEEIEPAVNSADYLCFKCGIYTDVSELCALYKEFLKLNEAQREKILNLIELEKNIEKIKLLLSTWRENKLFANLSSDGSLKFLNYCLHITSNGPSFEKDHVNTENTIIERADIILDGLLKAQEVAEKNEEIKKRTEEFERKYPGMFFPWQEIPNNDLVRRLKDVENKYEDLDKVYELQDSKSEEPLEKLHYLEAECSNRIANIRACIKTKDFEEGKGLNYYVKELIMFYQARQAVRDEEIKIKAEIEISEFFEVLENNVAQETKKQTGDFSQYVKKDKESICFKIRAKIRDNCTVF